MYARLAPSGNSFKQLLIKMPGSDLNGTSSSRALDDSNSEYSGGVDSGYAASSPMTAPLSEENEGNSINNLKPDVFTDSTGDGLRRTPSQQLQSYAHMNQEEYNNNRVALGRTISSVEDILLKLSSMSQQHQIYFPDSKTPIIDMDDENKSPSSSTSMLPTAEFHVLKLDLKVGHTGQEYSHKLENASLVKLLENRIVQVQKHLKALQERINDTSSKVLITGDVNSGKSTFCNALIGRKILPVDQQPCTNVFCEVHDCRDNFGTEEVHAVPIGREYNRLDGSTFEVHPLEDLETLVWEQDKYSLLKVYVDEKRPSERSLLRNGVADIALIDAPGLNRDSYQTTQLFSRQEEIDLVVFVVSAENHFTLSAKEFIGAAAHEKSLIYIVVNRFDTIRDKERCKRRILDQVADLSPETHKDARDFVHFVGENNGASTSSNGGGDGGGAGGGDDGPGDPDSVDNRFRHLEASLRSFVLEKRSVSKLAPAKTYLNNLLLDLERLARVNILNASRERENYEGSLDKITPQLKQFVRDKVLVSDRIEKSIEKTVQRVFDHTVHTITTALSDTSQPSNVSYNSIWHAYSYAVKCKAAIIERIRNSVVVSEEYAREQTALTAENIFALGVSHLGDEGHPEFKDQLTRPMFKRDMDTALRDVDAEVSLIDFVSFNFVLPSHTPAWVTKMFQFDSWSSASIQGKEDSSPKTLELASMNNALTVLSIVGGGRMILSSGFVRNIIDAVEILNTDTAKKLAIPVLVGLSALGVYKAVNDMPQTISRNISRKVAREVQELGYVGNNSKRLAKRTRRVLREPAETVREAFQREMDSKAEKCDKITRSLEECDVIHEYFSLLLRDATTQRRHVAKCQLEVVPSAV